MRKKRSLIYKQVCHYFTGITKNILSILGLTRVRPQKPLRRCTSTPLSHTDRKLSSSCRVVGMKPWREKIRSAELASVNIDARFTDSRGPEYSSVPCTQFVDILITLLFLFIIFLGTIFIQYVMDLIYLFTFILLFNNF